MVSVSNCEGGYVKGIQKKVEIYSQEVLLQASRISHFGVGKK
jgi:hypothetical protein